VSFICDYNLLILDSLVARCTTLAELQQAIASYPEDTRREGHVISGIQQFVAPFAALPAVVEATNQAIARRGGREALEQIRRQMELPESSYGYDE
jgi:hypothetical protein